MALYNYSVLERNVGHDFAFRRVLQVHDLQQEVAI